MESGVSMINHINLGSAKNQPPEKREQGAACTIRGRPLYQPTKPPLQNSSSIVLLTLISSHYTIGSDHSSNSAVFLAQISSDTIGHGRSHYSAQILLGLFGDTTLLSCECVAPQIYLPA